MALHKILVPYDGSDPSERALKFASMMGSQFSDGSKIVLLYVVGNIPVPPFFESPRYAEYGGMPTIDMHMKELYHKMKKDAKSMLEERKKQDPSPSKITTQVRLGEPSKVILEVAEEEKVDLIVIGTTSLKGIKRIKALGSIARKVAENSTRPVVLIP